MAGALKLATVGTGYFSRFHYEAWARIPEVSLVGICNRTREGAETVAAQFSGARTYTDFEAMLEAERPDIVDIITPPETHLAYVSLVAARGIPAICQKAFCRNLAEAREAESRVAGSPAPVIVHENFRFQPWHRAAKALIDDGTLGDLYQVLFRLRPGDGQGPRAYLDRQPYFQGMEQFLIHETAIHLVDTFRYFFGEVSSVYADLKKLNPVIAGEDAGLVLFDFTQGAQGVFDGNRLADHAADNRRRTMGEMWIEGSKATLRLEGSGALFLRRHGENTEAPVLFSWRDSGFGGDCVYNLQRHMIDHLVKGGQSKIVLRSICPISYWSRQSTVRRQPGKKSSCRTLRIEKKLGIVSSCQRMKPSIIRRFPPCDWPMTALPSPNRPTSASAS